MDCNHWWLKLSISEGCFAYNHRRYAVNVVIQAMNKIIIIDNYILFLMSVVDNKITVWIPVFYS